MFLVRLIGSEGVEVGAEVGVDWVGLGWRGRWRHACRGRTHRCVGGRGKGGGVHDAQVRHGEKIREKRVVYVWVCCAFLRVSWFMQSSS